MTLFTLNHKRMPAAQLLGEPFIDLQYTTGKTRGSRLCCDRSNIALGFGVVLHLDSSSDVEECPHYCLAWSNAVNSFEVNP